MLFVDRQDAGVKLAAALIKYSKTQAIVLGLPRGGVVVAREVAKALELPLDITCPRKIGAPSNLEFAIGAVTETGKGILNPDIIQSLGISDSYLQRTIEEETNRAKYRLELFRKNRPPRNLKDKIVIIVDDGLATGATMKAAIETVKFEHALKIIVAIPVAPMETIGELKKLVNEVICLATPSFFEAIGQFYQNFFQVDDEEVCALLDNSMNSDTEH